MEFGWLLVQASHDDVQPSEVVFVVDVGLRGVSVALAVAVDIAKHSPVFWQVVRKSVFHSDRVGGPPRRIYTDLLSRETDRVVWEFDIESLTALEEMTKSATADAEFRAAYEQWWAGLQPLIEGAVVELWSRAN